MDHIAAELLNEGWSCLFVSAGEAEAIEQWVDPSALRRIGYLIFSLFTGKN